MNWKLFLVLGWMPSRKRALEKYLSSIGPELVLPEPDSIMLLDAVLLSAQKIKANTNGFGYNSFFCQC